MHFVKCKCLWAYQIEIASAHILKCLYEMECWPKRLFCFSICFVNELSKQPGLGSDPPIGSGREWGATVDIKDSCVSLF